MTDFYLLTWTTSSFITLSSCLFLAMKLYMTRMYSGGSVGLKQQQIAHLVKT